MKRRIRRITLETRRDIVVPEHEPAQGWCSQCGALVTLVEINETGSGNDRNSAELKTKELHVINSGKATLICRESLPNDIKRRI